MWAVVLAVCKKERSWRPTNSAFFAPAAAAVAQRAFLNWGEGYSGVLHACGGNQQGAQQQVQCGCGGLYKHLACMLLTVARLASKESTVVGHPLRIYLSIMFVLGHPSYSTGTALEKWRVGCCGAWCVCAPACIRTYIHIHG